MISVQEISLFSITRTGVVTIVIKGYYDGSGDCASSHITLAGFAGTPSAWSEFEQLWGRFSSHWGAPRGDDTAVFSHLHMSDAFTLNREFSKKRGWTKDKVNQVTTDLLNRCMVPISFNRRTEFRGASATVAIDDYKRAAKEFTQLPKVKPPEALCVDFVVSVAFSLLPDDTNGVAGKDGKVELIFDRNEPFQRTIQRMWESRKGYAKLLSSIASDVAEETPALQAADFLAWSANRAYSREDGFFHLAPIMTGSTHKLFQYEDIVASYKRACALLGRPA